MNIRELENKGLIQVGENTQIDENVIFLPTDQTGQDLPIKIGAGVRIMPSAMICGGAVISDGAVIEAQVILGQPEYGYAIGKTFPGKGKKRPLVKIQSFVLVLLSTLVLALVKTQPSAIVPWYEPILRLAVTLNWVMQ